MLTKFVMVKFMQCLLVDSVNTNTLYYYYFICMFDLYFFNNLDVCLHFMEGIMCVI